MPEILVGNVLLDRQDADRIRQVLPGQRDHPEDRLRFYASRFPIVEIDSSYYGIPSVDNARLWVERTPPGFVFNIKTYRLFHPAPDACPESGEGASGSAGSGDEEKRI
jgi:hypothetical protein